MQAMRYLATDAPPIVDVCADGHQPLSLPEDKATIYQHPQLPRGKKVIRVTHSVYSDTCAPKRPALNGDKPTSEPTTRDRKGSRVAGDQGQLMQPHIFGPMSPLTCPSDWKSAVQSRMWRGIILTLAGRSQWDMPAGECTN